MTKKLPLNFILAITFVMGCFHLLGTYFYLYWQLPGFDRIVHTIGGFLAALISLVIIYFYRMPQVRKSHILYVGIFAAIVLGFGWELFEFISGNTSFADKDFYYNNVGDMLCDTLGGLIAVYYFIRTYSI
jgi:uncharacterized membrane protein YjdF